jgi:glycosyltransferase involved in cell wall biosynthesis
MRLLHIIPSLDWGSAERQLPLVFGELPGERFDQRLIVLRGHVPAGFPREDRITALELPSRFDLASCRQLRQCVRDFAPDILHSWRRQAGRLVAASCTQVKARRVVSVWQWRSSADWWGRALDYATLRATALRLAPSWMESSARFPAARLTSVGYGITPADGDDRKRRCRQKITQALGIRGDVALVGVVGPLLRESRVQDAIWAGDLLKVVRDDVHVIVAGYGPLAGRLRTFRRQAQIEDRVHFVSQSQHIDAALSASDCVWITGQTCVGMPTLLEAMARGIPVIATDLPCHRRYVSDQHTGMIVNVGHRAGFARQTLRLLEATEMASQLATAAAATVARRCAVPQVAAQYAALYGRLRASAA